MIKKLEALKNKLKKRISKKERKTVKFPGIIHKVNKKKDKTFIIKIVSNPSNKKRNEKKVSKKRFISKNNKKKKNNSEKKNISSLVDFKEEKEKIKKQKKLDAFELKELEYDEAIIKDKRSFIQTYLDILCREHRIIFTFLICNDYNLIYIKIARFIFLVATDIAMNVFFFSDDSMHKIFLNYGKYDFIQQIPQIIYTTVISQLLEVIICYLSLTDKHIYKIKNLIDSDKKQEILKIFKRIKVKLIIFFCFTFIVLIFYWYIVSAFCSVYKNTQIIFLKDSLFSFLSGLIYPFFLYLFPTTLRKLSLKLGIKYIYKLSEFIPIF